jgi:large subunit ribosomal protein L44e
MRLGDEQEGNRNPSRPAVEGVPYGLCGHRNDSQFLYTERVSRAPMHYPKVVSTYCPRCKVHTDHDVEKGKKRTASELKWGQRRFRRATRGYGGFPRPKPEGRAKAVRRVYLKYKCKKCKYTVQPASFRAGSLELVEKH